MRTNDLHAMLRRVLANEQAHVPDAQLLLRYVETRDERALRGLGATAWSARLGNVSQHAPMRGGCR